MKKVVIDIETDGLNPKYIWCIVTKELGEAPIIWLPWDYKEFVEYASMVDLWIAHNGVSFDIPVLRRILQVNIPDDHVLDTFIVSRLVNYSRFSTHSLKELGIYLGVHKGEYNDWSRLTPEMVDYCCDDVLVTEAVYRMYERFIDDPEWADAIRLEHDMAWTNNEMTANGFEFDSETAQVYLDEIISRKTEIEAEFQKLWPPQLVEVNRIQYRMKLDGTPMKTVTDAISNYPAVQVDGTDLICFDYRSFNPGAAKDRVDKLWEAGWSPFEKTKTHMKFERQGRVGEPWGKKVLTEEMYEEKRENFKRYGWTVSEKNLETLPSDAPEGARKLAQWLCLEGRRSSLVEWLGCVSEDGRIHGKFWNIGAWTHRMSHSAPNQANIFAPFHDEPRNEVEKIKQEYDEKLRALWKTSKVLVGTDADGIQLRILACIMKSEDYRTAILTGDKKFETDIHNLNKSALGDVCLSRDDAKTFN